MFGVDNITLIGLLLAVVCLAIVVALFKETTRLRAEVNEHDRIVNKQKMQIKKLKSQMMHGSIQSDMTQIAFHPYDEEPMNVGSLQPPPDLPSGMPEAYFIQSMMHTIPPHVQPQHVHQHEVANVEQVENVPVDSETQQTSVLQPESDLEDLSEPVENAVDPVVLAEEEIEEEADVEEGAGVEEEAGVEEGADVEEGLEVSSSSSSSSSSKHKDEDEDHGEDEAQNQAEESAAEDEEENEPSVLEQIDELQEDLETQGENEDEENGTMSSEDVELNFADDLGAASDALKLTQNVLQNILSREAPEKSVSKKSVSEKSVSEKSEDKPEEDLEEEEPKEEEPKKEEPKKKAAAAPAFSFKCDGAVEKKKKLSFKRRDGEPSEA